MLPPVLFLNNKGVAVENVDMMAAEVEDRVRQAAEAHPVARVGLLAEAVSLAVDPLVRLRVLMLLADAAGRAAHGVAGEALAGRGCPGGEPATWAQIGAAATLARDTAWRQWHGGEALSWSPAARGVRSAIRRGEGSRA